MEALIKDYSKLKNEVSLTAIASFLSSNPIESYISSLNVLISNVLNARDHEQLRYQIIIYIIDLFTSMKIPPEQLVNLAIDRLFEHEEPVYQLNPGEKIVDAFYSTYFPNQQLINSLKKPSFTEIDFLKVETQKETISSWTQASARSTEAQFKIIHEGIESELSLNKASIRIQPFGLFSTDYEWRKNIKEGDEIDFLDTSKTWYLSTVLERKDNSEHIKIGLRVYRENGKITDHTDKKFVGWGNEFNINCSIHDSRIRPPKTFSRDMMYLNTTSSYPLDYKKFNEHQLHIPFNNQFYVIPKEYDRKQFNIFYLTICNYFLKIISTDNCLLLQSLYSIDNFDYYCLYCSILHRLHEKLNVLFAKRFLKIFYAKSIKLLISFSQTETRNFKKTVIQSLIRKIRDILNIAYYETDLNIIFNSFSIQFGINCLSKSTILEKQLLGLSLLSNTIIDANKQISTNDLIDPIKSLLASSPNLFALLFASNSHSQIIQKSYDIINNMFKLKIITNVDCAQLISYMETTQDPEIEGVLIKVFSSNIRDLGIELSMSLVDNILKKKNYNLKDIAMAIEVSTGCYKPESQFLSRKVLQDLLNYLIENHFSIDIENDISKLLRFEDDIVYVKNIIRDYVPRVISSVNNDNIEHCIKIIKAMINRISNLFGSDEQLQSELWSMLFDSKNILDEIISYFKSGKFASFVLQFLTFIAEKFKKYDFISNEIIQIFVDIFNNEQLKNSEQFYKWLSNAETMNLIQSSTQEFMFNTPIKDTISKYLYDYLWKAFFTVNHLKSFEELAKDDKKIQKVFSSVTSQGKILYSYSYSPSENQQKLVNKIILPNSVSPFDLKYFDYIFLALINMTTTIETKKETFESFLQLFAMKDLKSDMRKDIWFKFIEKCINVIKDSDSLVQRKRNAISVLVMLIEESERMGTAGCVSHMASMKSPEMQFEVTDNITKDNKTFFIQTLSNSTIWDLKVKIAQYLGIIPECIKILQDSTEITDRENGVVLGKKFFKESKIIVTKSSILDDIPRVALVKNGALTSEAKQVITSIFEKYSTKGKMNREQCSQFAFVAVDSIEKISVDDQRVRIVFDKYDSDKDDYVTVEGFCQFFLDAIEIDKKIYTVWENIKAFGYRNDLKSLNDPLHEFNNEDDKTIMPRYILSQNQAFFEELFLCQNSLDKDLAKEASELINMICTNQKYFKLILDQGKEYDDILTNESNEYVLFYLFQIIESLIGSNGNETQQQQQQWVNAYLYQGGFETLLKKKFITESMHQLSSKVTLCIRKIILESFEIIFDMKQYDSLFDGEFLNDSIKKIDNDSLKIIKSNADDLMSKYYIKDIVEHLIKCIESMKQTDKLFSLEEDISKKQMNILALLIIYFNNKVLSMLNIEEFILGGLIQSKDISLRRQFSYTIGVLFLQITSEEFKLSVSSVLLTNAFKSNLSSGSISHYLLALYRYILKIQPLSSEKATEFAEKLIAFLSLNPNLNCDILLDYFHLLNVALNYISTDSKLFLCKEKKLLNILVNDFLIENLDKPQPTRESPEELYLIIAKLIDSNSENLYELFSYSKIQNLNQYVTQLKEGKENYNPLYEKRSFMSNHIGINNLRNICYMNSVLQQFFNVSAFRNGILSAKDNLPSNKTEIEDDNLLHQLQRMFTFLQLSKRNDYVPFDFVYSFKDIESKPTDYTIQCDAQEFLSRFMEKIEIMLSKTQYKHLMKGIFYGETCSQLLCQNGCGDTRNRFEELLYLSLDIKHVSSLKETLQKYILEETIDDFLCEQCQKKVKHTKRISLNKLPNVLIIHLQRITFNYETFLMEKINSKLEFPMKLNMKQFTTETISQPNPEDREFDAKVYLHKDEYYEYQLKGVVVHSGTAQFGHYYSLINTELSNDNSWYRFDDSSVYMYDQNKLSEDTFGGEVKTHNQASAGDWFNPSVNTSEWEESSKGAYMLVYERKLKSPLILVENTINCVKEIDMSIESSSVVNYPDEYKFYKDTDPFNPHRTDKYDDSFLDCEDTASSRNNNQKITHRVFNVKNEQVLLLPYYSYINNKEKVNYNKDYLIEVCQDNIIYRNDLCIYNIHFSDLIKKCAFNLSTDGVFLDKDKIILIFTTISKIVIQFLSKINDKKDINEIITNQLDTLKQYPYLLDFILNEFIENKTRFIFTFILTLEDQINQPFKNYITQAIISSMSNSESQDKAIEVLNYLYSLIPMEISQHWVKMVNFFDIFDALAKENNEHILNYLYSKNTISVFIDFFLGKESPLHKQGESRNEIGNKTVTAKFSPLLSAISSLVRRCPNLIGETQLTTFITSPCQYTLTKTDIDLLSNNIFYKKAINDKYNNSVLSKLISHLMYNDYDFTEKRIFSLLETISKSTAVSDVKNVFSLLFNILINEDAINMFRNEALIGIPMLSIRTESLVNSKIKVNGIRYRSCLFPNKDTLIDRIVNNWKNSVDKVMFLSYLYGIVLGGNKIFNYYFSLPGPKNCDQTLNDFIVQQGKTEIEWLKSCNFDKKYESFIAVLENCINKKYEEKIKEIEGEKRIEFYPKVKLGNILWETIKHIKNDECNAQECYLLQCDFVIEIESNENKGIKVNEVNNAIGSNNNKSADTKLNASKLDAGGLAKPTFDKDDNKNNEDEIINTSSAQSSAQAQSHSSIKNKLIEELDANVLTQCRDTDYDYDEENEDKRSNNAVFGDDENSKSNDINQNQNSATICETTTFNAGNKLHYDNSSQMANKNDSKPIIYSLTLRDVLCPQIKKSGSTKNVNSSEETNVIDHPLAADYQLDKNYYIENISNILLEKETFRQFLETNPLNTLNVRSYILVNNSNKEYKSSIKITESKSAYYPKSVLVNFLRKKSSNQVITLIPSHSLEDDVVQFEIEPFEISNNDLMAEQYEIKNKKPKSKSFDNNDKTKKLAENLIENQSSVSFNHEKNTNQYDNTNDGCEISCPCCNTQNIITNNDYVLKCKYCQASLF